MPLVHWDTAGTAIVELTIPLKPGDILKKTLGGCFVKKEANLRNFVETFIDPSADRNKYTRSDYLFYSPVSDFQGRVSKAVISYEKISKELIGKRNKQKTTTYTVEEPLVITCDGHFFLCCDQQPKSEFLEQYSKKVMINQTLDLSKKFCGLINEDNMNFLKRISFNMRQSQNHDRLYEFVNDTQLAFNKLLETGPLLLDDNKTVVGCYRKTTEGNNRFEIDIFGKQGLKRRFPELGYYSVRLANLRRNRNNNVTGYLDEMHWDTAGTAIVELTIPLKPGDILKKTLGGCFVKKEANLRNFVETFIDPSADRNKYDRSHYLLYSPVSDFKGRVSKAVISYEEISKKLKTKEYTVKEPLVITCNGHFFLCCDQELKSDFLDEYSKEVRIDQTLDLTKKFCGLTKEDNMNFLKVISFYMQQSQNHDRLYEFVNDTQLAFNKLLETGPLLLDDNKTVVGCYRKTTEGNKTLEIDIFGKQDDKVRRQEEKLIRFIKVKTTFVVLGVQLAGASVLRLLYRYWPNLEGLDVLLPFRNFGLQLFGFFAGSVVFVLKVPSISSLKQLWQSYNDGELEKELKKAFNEMEDLKKLSQGKEIDVEVTIDEEEYREVLLDLILLEVTGKSMKNTRSHRRHSAPAVCPERDVPEESDKLMDVTQIETGAGPPVTELEKRPESKMEHMDIDSNKNADMQNNPCQPQTLGTLFKQDMEKANILSVYPTSFVQGYRFLNDEKYLIYNIQKSGHEKNNPFLFLYPGKICSVAGNEFPVLMDKQPCDDIMDHWKTWLPDFPEPVFKTIDEGIEDEDPIVTIFPMQRIPEEKHAIDPDTHYQILLKSAIPETGAPCPEHYTRENAVFPCMVKVDQSLSGYGNYVCNNQEELAASLETIDEAFGNAAPYVITEFVKNVDKTLGCQFYLNKEGEIHWLGTNVNVLNGNDWVGSEVDWDLQDEQRERVFDSFIIPVADYLHRKGYFGIAGIDIVCSPSGDYLVDMNARLTGFTPHALIAPVMARQGLTKSHFKSADNHDCSTEELIRKVNSVNETRKGKIFILNSMDVDEGCIAAILAFAETMKGTKELFKLVK